MGHEDLRAVIFLQVEHLSGGEIVLGHRAALGVCCDVEASYALRPIVDGIGLGRESAGRQESQREDEGCRGFGEMCHSKLRMKIDEVREMVLVLWSTSGF